MTSIACTAAFMVPASPAAVDTVVSPDAPAIHEAEQARGTVLLPRRVKMLISYHQAVTV
ncbi:MAG: hypothetical protein AAGB34_00660 [Planctomycetota bacterium]